MENKGKKAFISVAELAKLLGVSHVAVFKRIQNGSIDAQKIGNSYAIESDHVDEILNRNQNDILTESKKTEIRDAVNKVVKEYGETLKLLGKE